MTQDQRSEGATNDRPRDETIAGTGPGLPDEALGRGQQWPEAPTDQQVAAAAKAIGAPVPDSDAE